jgi:hypothetical protein
VPAALLLGATTHEALPLEEACTPLQVSHTLCCLLITPT